jgi:hypothetical protein
MYLKFKANAFALASALTTAIIYTVGSVLIKFYPTECLQVTAPCIYLDRLRLFKMLGKFFSITPSNFFIGLAEIVFYSYITSLLLALFYNLFVSFSDRNSSTNN